MADQINIDLYSVLNIPKTATIEEIKNAYKKMCIIFHPDKQMNENLKSSAIKKFNEIKMAYNVLSDNKKRVIYDLYGVIDESIGKEIVPFNKYPNDDPRLNYLKKLYERELIDSFTLSNPKSLAKMVIDISPFFDQQLVYETFLEKVLAVKNTSFVLTNSVDIPIYKENVLSLSANLTCENNNGSGKFIGSYTHKNNDSLWHKVDLIISDGVHLVTESSKTFANRFSLSFGIISLLKQDVFAFAFKPAVTVRLNNYLSSSISWQTALPSTLTKSIFFQTPTTKMNLRLNFSLYNTFISLNNYYKFSDKVRLLNKNKISYHGMNQSFGLHYIFNKFSSCSAVFHYGTMGGIFFDIRIQQTGRVFSLPIILSDEFQMNSFIYGLFIFPISIYLVKNHVVDWLYKKQQRENTTKNAQQTALIVEESRLEAELCIKLMTDAYNRILEAETTKNGLIISKAYYGTNFDSINENYENIQKIDVKIPLQCLVTDSKLIIPSGSKTKINGFYDVMTNQPKMLYVEYVFRGKLHQTIISDQDSLAIPKLSHML